MDHRNQSAAFWGPGLSLWCRLWQAQMEHSLRFWAAWAARLPHADAAQLAAEAEAMKSIACRTGAAKARAAAAKRRGGNQRPAPRHATGRGKARPAPPPLH